MTDYGFRGNAGSSSPAIKLRIYFWNPSLLLDAANVKMLPIVNINVANWKLGIGIGNNGNT